MLQTAARAIELLADASSKVLLQVAQYQILASPKVKFLGPQSLIHVAI